MKLVVNLIYWKDIPALFKAFPFLPTGNFLRLAAIHHDCTIRLWKLAGSSCRVFEGHTDAVSSVTFSPDGSTLASGSNDKSIRLWNVSEGTCTRTLRDSRMDKVYSTAWSPDGATIATAENSGLIYFWDVSNEKNTTRAPVIVQGHDGAVTTIVYSREGRYLASGSGDTTVKLWNVANLSCAKVFTGHTDWVQSVCFSPNGKNIASGSYDQNVETTSAPAATDGGSCLVNLSGHHVGFVSSVSFSPDGRALASGSWDNSVRLVEVCA
jgi:WD40 repeat protein